MILVAVYDDHRDRRESLQLLISHKPDLHCIGVYENCSNVVEDLAEALPDVVLMDIGMPGMSGIEAVKLIRKHYPAVKILMQTVFEEEGKIFESIVAGASGYILKKQSVDALIQAIYDIYQGGAVMTPSVASRVLDTFQKLQRAESSNSFQLSEREKEILAQLVKGLSYKMIAERCQISFHTVNSHMKNIYEKLHVHSVAEAVSKALQQKIV
jgi:DNA-binding NarL/FixJ family response regulator